MSFDISNLALISYANGRGTYTYKSTADSLATILASGYFGQDSTTGQQASDMLNAGDVILCEGTDGNMILRVDTVSGTTVTTEAGMGESQVLTVAIQDLQTAGGLYVAAPFDGVVRRTKLVTNGELPNADTVTFSISGTTITGASLTLDESGEPAGAVYESVATGNNAVSEGDAVKIEWTGSGSGSELQANEADATVQIEFVPV